MNKCQDCEKETKELYEVVTPEGTKWFCKICATNYDPRITSTHRSKQLKRGSIDPKRYKGPL